MFTSIADTRRRGEVLTMLLNRKESTNITIIDNQKKTLDS